MKNLKIFLSLLIILCMMTTSLVVVAADTQYIVNETFDNSSLSGLSQLQMQIGLGSLTFVANAGGKALQIVDNNPYKMMGVSKSFDPRTSTATVEMMVSVNRVSNAPALIAVFADKAWPPVGQVFVARDSVKALDGNTITNVTSTPTGFFRLIFCFDFATKTYDVFVGSTKIAGLKFRGDFASINRVDITGSLGANPASFCIDNLQVYDGQPAAEATTITPAPAGQSTPAPAAGAIYQETFESAAASTFKAVGNGTLTIKDKATGGKYLHVSDNDDGAIGAWQLDIESPLKEDFTLTFDFVLDSTSKGSPICYASDSAVAFPPALSSFLAGKFAAFNADKQVAADSGFEKDVWAKVIYVFRPASHTFDTYINGKKVADNFTFRNAAVGQINYFQFGGSMSPSPIDFGIDNVFIHAGAPTADELAGKTFGGGTTATTQTPAGPTTPTAAPSQPAGPAGTLYTQNFDSMTNGAAPASITPNGEGGTMTIKDREGGGKYLEIIDETDATNYGWSLDIPEQKDRFTLVYDVMYSDKNTAASMQYMRDASGGGMAAVCVFFSKTIGAFNGSDNKTIEGATLEPNKWHKVVFDVTPGDKKFTLYANGKKVADGFGFRNTEMSSIAKLQFICGTNGIIHCGIDNVKVYTGAPADADLK